jgi:hypothetical protein
MLRMLGVRSDQITAGVQIDIQGRWIGTRRPHQRPRLGQGGPSYGVTIHALRRSEPVGSGLSAEVARRTRNCCLSTSKVMPLSSALTSLADARSLLGYSA